jgi:hypothetical protein
MSRNALFELVENVKEKITSEEYKNLVEEIAKMANDQDYIVSIFYIEYHKNVSGHMVKFSNEIKELKIKVRQSEITPQHRERVDEISKQKEYTETHPRFLLEILPRLYHRQLYNFLVLEGEYVGHDSDEDCSEDCEGPIASYVTQGVMFKISVDQN